MADPVFNYIATNPFGLSGANPALVDIDGDGDLDAFSGAKGDTLFFRNTGTTNNPQFAPAFTNPFGLSDVGQSILSSGLYVFSANPTFVDIDGDSDLDAFVGNGDGDTFFL